MGVESITYPTDLSSVEAGIVTNATSIAAAQADITTLYLNTSSTTMTVEAHTGNDTLTTAESGSVHTSFGAGEIITLTLPASASAGVWFVFAVQAAFQLRIDPGAKTIRDVSGQTPDKYKRADAIGECMALVADTNGDWMTIARHGVWNEQD